MNLLPRNCPDLRILEYNDDEHDYAGEAEEGEHDP